MLQESRFRLVTDDGQGLLLSLAHDAPLEIEDLQKLHDADVHVFVEYEGKPNTVSGRWGCMPQKWLEGVCRGKQRRWPLWLR